MSCWTLSFTLVQRPHIGLSWKTCWKFATFRCEAELEPLSFALPKAFAFSSILYPLDNSAFLTVSLLNFYVESPSGLPCFAYLTHDRLRIHLYSGGNYVPLSLTFLVQRPTHSPFWLRCISLFSPVTRHEAYDDSLSLSISVSPLLVYRLRLPL
jgi:hypothetical protein